MTSRPVETRAARLRRWLKPGSGIKRWLLVMLLGLTILATAGALLIRVAFRDVPADSPPGMLFEIVSLNFLPDPVRPLVVVALGVATFAVGLWGLLRVLLAPAVSQEEAITWVG